VAGYCCVLLFGLGLAACGFGGQREEVGGAMFGLLLHVAALAAMIVWLTARDVATDEPPEDRGPRGFEPKLTRPPTATEERPVKED
jgi:hypothetical protein